MKNPLVILSVKYGAAAAFLLMALFIALFYMGKHPINISVLDIRFLILPLFMAIAMKDFRDNKNEKSLHFWQGLSVGAIVFFTIGILISLFIIVFSIIDPDFLQMYIDDRIALIVDHRDAFVEQLGEVTVQEQLEKLPLTTSFNLAIDYFVRTIAIGLILNILISIILRKQPKLT